LLAFVLALALIWNSLDPVPIPSTHRKRDDELPDEKQGNLEPHSMPAMMPLIFRPIGVMVESLLTADRDEDDFEWPEFINC
jgi:hypothetical protein